MRRLAVVSQQRIDRDLQPCSRIDQRGREYVLFYSPELENHPDNDYFRDPGDDLPPMRLRIPLNK